MNNSVKNSAKKVNTIVKKDVNKVEKKSTKVVKVVSVKRSNWKENVLATNKAYKTIHKSFGGVRALILKLDDTQRNEVNLLPIFEEILKASTDKKVYDFLLPLIRVSSAGNYGIFYTISSLHKLVNDDEQYNKYIALTTNNAK